MTRARILRAIVTAVIALGLTGLSVSCGGPYIPSVKNGTCNPGRTWVPPRQDSTGKWHEGYCQDAK